MTTLDRKEQDYFERAFALAYYLHVNKEIAIFVAEDALEGLESMLGYHEKNRRPTQKLRGFLKSGERARPVRKTMTLSEPQMVQWLVYKHSELWERQTEQGEGFYVPTEEDLIVRYLEYLVFITSRQGSFYTTLAIGSLLHQFDRRETRLFYDILTQSDSARMKDMNYIGKQRLELLERISQRFGNMIETANRPGGEKQFVTRPNEEWVAVVVRESLKRFTPWETTCVIEPGFDVTDASGLYFPEGGADDEELIELNRIHTVIDPLCLERFAHGLAKYVHTLPGEDPDKDCNYEDLAQRVAVPQFSNFTSGSSRGDRFESPQLTKEDFVRLQRTLASRARRRRTFVPRQLRVYLDSVLSYSMDFPKSNRGRWLIGEAEVIEVRGEDDAGELTLATVILSKSKDDEESQGGSITYDGGQTVTIRITPERSLSGAGDRVWLEVRYEDSKLRKPLSKIRRIWLKLITGGESAASGVAPAPALWKPAVAVAFVLLVTAFLAWQVFRLRQSQAPTQPVAQSTPQPGDTRIVSVTPLPTPKPSASREPGAIIAQATWSMDPDAASKALSLEATRAGTQIIELQRDRTKVLLSVPTYDDRSQIYLRYRATLSANGTRLWQETVRAPKISLTGYTHIMNLDLFADRLPPSKSYNLQIEGSSQAGWQILGKVKLQARE